MAKVKSRHHFEKFFIVFGVLISILALGVIVYSSQQKTSTQSDASGGCTKTPNIIDSGIKVKSSGNYNSYITITNNCSGAKTFLVKATPVTNISDQFLGLFEFTNDGAGNPLKVYIRGNSSETIFYNANMIRTDRNSKGIITASLVNNPAIKTWREFLVTPSMVPQ